MVKNHLFISILCVALSGCGIVNRWWGEEAPDREIVRLEEGKACAEPDAILLADEAKSLATLDCWAAKVDDLFSQIQGKENQRLTEAEFETLFEKQIIVLAGNRAEGRAKLRSIRKLISVDNGISKLEIDNWVSWIRENRQSIRKNLRTFKAWSKDSSTGASYLGYGDLRSSAELVSSFLRRMKWNMDSKEFAKTVQPLLGSTFQGLEGSLVTIADVLSDSLGVICPNTSENLRWDPHSTAGCLDLLFSHFEKGAPWFESLLNPYSHKSPSRESVTSSLNALVPLVSSWTRQKNLRPANTYLWIKMGETLGLKVDNSSLNSIDWIHRFNRDSNFSRIDPTILSTFFDIVAEAQKRTLEALPLFAHCDFTRASDWDQCPISPPASVSEHSLDVALALRVRNLHYAEHSVPLSRSLYNRIIFFNVVSQKIIDAFDGKEKGHPGIITVETFSEPEELLKILQVALNFQKNTEFAEEIAERLKGNVPQPRRDVLRHYKTENITRLVTLMGDVLVRPDKQEEKLFDDFGQLLKTLRLRSKDSALFLDRTRMTSVIAMVDTLSTFRSAYINSDEKRLGIPLLVDSSQAGSAIVTRESILDSIPRILKEHFPRLHRSCESFAGGGWDRSCKVVFEELVPGENPADFIYASDLDVLTLAAIFSESLLDYCDRDGDGTLEGYGFRKGDDEMDCTFMKLKDAAFRLMDAGIIEESKSARRLIRFADTFFLTRAYAKAAIDQGDKNPSWGHIFKIWHQEADQGSIFGLAADVIDEKIEPPAGYEKKKKRFWPF